MKLGEIFSKLLQYRSKIREVSNVIIRVIDAIDGHQDWVKKVDGHQELKRKDNRK